MGDEPLLPLPTNRHSKIRETVAQVPVATANRRDREVIAEIWPEISFRNKLKRLRDLLLKLQKHFEPQKLQVSLVRCDQEVLFLLEDKRTHTTYHIDLEQACRLQDKDPENIGQLLDQQC